MNNKLNTFSLSGLIVGPILGTGIIILPPMIYDIIGNYSLIEWIVISFLGFLFAFIFAKLTIMFKGKGGVASATEKALGDNYKLLTSFYLIFAVCFGPVAVLLIGVEYIGDYFLNFEQTFIALVVYVSVYILQLNKITFIGTIMLVSTSIISLILLISSVYILMEVETFTFELPSFNLKDIGYSFLLIFWAIVGWEIIGNYSEDVINNKTIQRAILLSSLAITSIYILVAMSICFGNFPKEDSESFQLIWIIRPIFQNYSELLLSIVTLLLSTSTLVMFIGGVARLMASLKLTRLSSKYLENGAPIGALSILAVIHISILFLFYMKIIDIAGLIAIADGFFIANAMIGLSTAIILFDNGFLKNSAYLLLFVFSCILLFSNIYILFIIVGLFIYTYKKQKHDCNTKMT